MLKIKDNVDLKELEKFGFKLEQSMDNGKYYYTNRPLFIDNRIVKQMDMYNPFSEIDYELGYWDIYTIYNLTKANLIEWVVE